MKGPKRTSIMLMRADYEWLKLRSARTDQSVSAIIRDAVAAYREKLEAEAQAGQ